MAAPALTHTGERLVEALGPLDAEPEASGYTLQWFMAALATGWDTVADIARDQDDGTPGFAILFDPDLCPAEFLDWVAQFVGVRMLPGLTEEQKRLRLKQTDGAVRGTPEAIEGAARQFLIGPDGTGDTATVNMLERFGSPYGLLVSSLISETPDPASVLRALLEQKPAGIKLTYTTVAGGDWDTLTDLHSDWADVASTFATWADVREDPSVI